MERSKLVLCIYEEIYRFRIEADQAHWDGNFKLGYELDKVVAELEEQASNGELWVILF